MIKKYKCIKEHTNSYEVDGFGGYYTIPFKVKFGMTAEVSENDGIYYPDLSLNLIGKDAIRLECFEEC